jgi:hypothetical protein
MITGIQAYYREKRTVMGATKIKRSAKPTGENAVPEGEKAEPAVKLTRKLDQQVVTCHRT